MSVRFVIGRAGSGKTKHCFDSIVEALSADPLGPPIYWILPKQATFSAERELTCESGLGGFCRARVLSFEQLGHDLLTECGGAAIPAVNSLGRQMLLGHLLKQLQPQLKFFKAVARQPGLAARLDTAFAEFDRCGKDPAALATLTDELRSGDDDLQAQFLVDKLADFHQLYAAYSNYLGQERLDPARRLTHVMSCLAHSKSVRGATVYVDGFLDFTDYERRVLAALGETCAHVEITMLADPTEKIWDASQRLDELDLFHRTTDALRRLRTTIAEASVEIDPPLLLKKITRFVSPQLAQIEQNRAGKPDESDGGLELIEALNRRTEVDVAARRIADLVRSGTRFRDIAVLVRDLDLYHELIAASFDEHGLPFFVDRRRTAAHHPVLQLTRAVLQIARNDWPHEAVMTLLKSGLAGITLDEADELENYVLLHRIRGNVWASLEPWTFNRTLLGEERDELPDTEKTELKRIDELRRKVVDKVSRFVDRQRCGTTRQVRQTVADLFQLFDHFKVSQTLTQWMTEAAAAGEHEQHDEHEQVWTELVELLDQLIDLLGDEQVELSDFIETLEAGLESFDLALTPPTVDQILVGQVDRTRTPRVEITIVLGLNEGTFPRTAREDSVLSDSERRVLRRRGVDVDPDSTRRMLDENLFGYLAFTRASRRLIVTRPLADDEGKPIAPSIFWRRLREMFPGIDPTTIDRTKLDAPENIGTPRQLVTMLMRWARNPNDSKLQPALYQWLTTHDRWGDPIDKMRFHAWRALSYSNDARLSPEVAQAFFKTPLHASVTRIETFATCPFKHYLRYGLKLEPREDHDVTPMDMGNVFHGILERIVRQVLEQRSDFCKLEPADAVEMVHQFAEEIGHDLRGELMISSARNKYLLQRIEKTLAQVIATQRAALSRGKFRPAFAELGFGIDGGALPAFEIKTPSGRKIVLHGKIDRVDLIEAEGRFAVIDYKLTGNSLALDRVYHGLSLQLLTYLLVLEASGQKLAGKKLTPAAAFYMRLLRKLDEVKHPDLATSPDDPTFDLNVKARGIFDEARLRDLDGSLESGPSDVVAAYIKKDGEFGKLDIGDHVDPKSFQSLLQYVRARLAELGDKILDGDISITPYRMGRETPCPNCEYRSVCRFDVSVNKYHPLQAMKRTTVLEVLRG